MHDLLPWPFWVYKISLMIYGMKHAHELEYKHKSDIFISIKDEFFFRLSHVEM